MQAIDNLLGAGEERPHTQPLRAYERLNGSSSHFMLPGREGSASTMMLSQAILQQAYATAPAPAGPMSFSSGERDRREGIHPDGLMPPSPSPRAVAARSSTELRGWGVVGAGAERAQPPVGHAAVRQLLDVLRSPTDAVRVAQHCLLIKCKPALVVSAVCVLGTDVGRRLCAAQYCACRVHDTTAA